VKRAVAFRVDSGSRVGSGHVMRCLALAGKLREEGYQSVFICRPSPGSVESWIEKAGYIVETLPESEGNKEVNAKLMHGDFLGSTIQEDADATLLYLEKYPTIELMVVDHYGICRPWDDIVGQKYKLIKIDDLADRPHKCAVLIDQNFYIDSAQRYDCLVENGARCLLGPTYALLRPEFRNVDISFRKSRQSDDSILVSCGGADNLGLSCKVAQDLLRNTEYKISVLGSPRLKDMDTWAMLHSEFPTRLRGPRFVSSPVDELKAADLYVGAGGTITWERFAVGLPGLVYSIAENQVAMARDLDRAGFQKYLGRIDAYSSEVLLQEVDRAKDRIRSESIKVRSLVDGCGVSRVFREIQDLL